MFEIDHVPIGHRDLGELAALFSRLGFDVSPACVFTSDGDPAQRWLTRPVFLSEGWLDLQEHPGGPDAAAPHGCLFRTDTWEAAYAGLPGFRMGAPERLSGASEDSSAPPVELVWTSIRERIAPLLLALVGYDGASRHPHSLRVEHPNTVVRLTGLIFGGAEPGPAHEAAGAHLDLTGFSYLPADQFDELFGAPAAGRVALRFAVSSPRKAQGCLEAQGFACSAGNGAIRVPAQGPLGFGIEFSQG